MATCTSLRAALGAAFFALPASALAAPISILLLGDSITAGQQGAPAGPSFAELLAGSLGAGFELTNAGCGGASSLDWTLSHAGAVCGSDFVLPGLYEALARPQLPADLVTVLLGTNDALGFFELEPTPPAIYRAALGELVANLLADGAGKVLLLTPPPLFEYPDTADPLLQGYRAAILDLCGAPGDALLCGPDVYALLAREDFAPGDVHPTGSGHAKLAAALHDAVQGAVPEPASALLLGSGLAVLAARRRARARRPR